MRPRLAALVIGLAAMAGTPVLAQTAADKADVRCLLVLNVAGRDPKNTEKAREGVYYYAGRLAARGSLNKVSALLLSEAQTMKSAQQAQAELTRCGTELNASTSSLSAAMQAAQAAARPAGAPPAPAPK